MRRYGNLALDASIDFFSYNRGINADRIGAYGSGSMIRLIPEEIKVVNTSLEVFL